MNRRLLALAAFGAFLGLSAERCPPPSGPTDCETHPGHGRYRDFKVCDRVETEDGTFELTLDDGVLALDGLPLARGVVRRELGPYVYVHRIDGRQADLTIDLRRTKTEIYPLYAGSSGTLFNLGMDDPHRWWPTDRWTVAQLDDLHRYWLVVNRATEEGLLLDLVERASELDWQLVAGDVLLPASGETVEVPTTALRLRLDRALAADGAFQDAVKFQATPVLFVHGHSRGSSEVWKEPGSDTSVKRALEVNGQLAIDPFFLDLPRFGAGRPFGRSIAADADDIGAEVDRILDLPRFEGVERLAIVAFSQGTLSSRIYVGGLPPIGGDAWPPVVSELVTLAAPNHGLGGEGGRGACLNAYQLDRSRRELCGGRKVQKPSDDVLCGECAAEPAPFKTNKKPDSPELSFFRELNGHALDKSCDADFEFAAEAPSSRPPGGDPSAGVLYVNLWAAGDELVGGGPTPADCAGRGLPLNHAPDAVNLGVPDVPATVHQNLPHHWPAICALLRTVVDHEPPIADGGAVVATACDGLTEP